MAKEREKLHAFKLHNGEAGGTHESKSGSPTKELCHQQDLFWFENGYGASVVRGTYTYGGDAGLFELAVTHYDHLCYKTDITDDVLGYLKFAEIQPLLDQIEALPVNKGCIHSNFSLADFREEMKELNN